MTDLRDRDRRLGDPYAFALLQWPAVVLLFELPGGFWWMALKVALAIWLAVSTLAALFGRYREAPQFGACVALCLRRSAASGPRIPARGCICGSRCCRSPFTPRSGRC